MSHNPIGLHSLYKDSSTFSYVLYSLSLITDNGEKWLCSLTLPYSIFFCLKLSACTFWFHHYFHKIVMNIEQHNHILKPQTVVFQILKEVDLGKSGDISSREFVHAITKMPDFATCFQLKV
jgi:hypothetical protein